jgi:protein-S-isoprenylcysteine O-methyltransferase Ste14
MSLSSLTALWLLFCILHSWLIAVSTTRVLKRVMGDHFRWFRLYYNAGSLIALVALLIATHNVTGRPVFAWDGGLRIPQYALVALSTIIFVVGARGYNLADFLGIGHLVHAKHPVTSSSIQSSGLHGIIRHPWYTGVFVLLWAHDQTTTSVAVNLVLSGYLVIGTMLEERKLILEFGDAYRDYQRLVSMFVPWIWLKNSLGFRRTE